jgi:hypothetical protein
MVKFISSTDEDYRRVIWHLKRIILYNSGVPSNRVDLTVIHSEAIDALRQRNWLITTAAQKSSEALTLFQSGSQLVLAQPRKSISTAFFFFFQTLVKHWRHRLTTRCEKPIVLYILRYWHLKLDLTMFVSTQILQTLQDFACCHFSPSCLRTIWFLYTSGESQFLQPAFLNYKPLMSVNKCC